MSENEIAKTLEQRWQEHADKLFRRAIYGPKPWPEPTSWPPNFCPACGCRGIVHDCGTIP